MQNLGNSAASRDKAHLVHPMTNLQRHLDVGPTIMARGKGVYVYDDAGKEYIEGMAGLWCASLGFAEDRLVEAATRQLRQLPYYQQFRHMSHTPGIDLAEKLTSMTPPGLNKAFFVNSGSEANDTIVKLIWYYNNAKGRPEKKKIIARQKGYHGTTIVASSLSGLPHMHAAFDLPLDRIKHTECPHWYRFGQDGESEEDFATRMADALEQLILDEGPDTVAAFFAEPVMGAGGVITPPKTYFEKVQAVLKKYDVLFVADEVICGFGRTGEMFGSFTYDLKPDFMTVAKALSSAYLPIAGLVMTDEVFETIARKSGELGILGHGYTYGGHPVSSAVALETLKIYEEIDIIGHIKRVSPALQQGLRALGSHPLVGEVRGVGLVAAVELVSDKETKAIFDTKGPVYDFLYERLMHHAIVTRPIVNSVAFSPPLIITEAETREMIARFKRALDDTAQMVRDRGLAAVA